MSIEKRRYLRFSLDIPAFRQTNHGGEGRILIKQISVGGCLAEWDEAIFSGEEFRLEISLPNRNRLPLIGKVIYRFSEKGVGIQFCDITAFEQKLLADIIIERVENEGLPVTVDPFNQPPRYFTEDSEENTLSLKKQERRRLDEITATGF